VKWQLVLDLLEHARRYADAARLGQTFQPRRNVDAVAVDVIIFDDHVAKVDADAEIDPPVVLLIGTAFHYAFLGFDSALDGINDACELDQQSITRSLDDATPSARNGRLDQFM